MKIPFWQQKTFWSALAALVMGLLNLYGVGEKYTQTAAAIFGFLTVLFVRDAVETSAAAVRKLSDSEAQ